MVPEYYIARVRAIHAKIANTRKDAMHKFSTSLVAKNGAIFVGNVSSKAMVKTKMAKSTLDAGWAMHQNDAGIQELSGRHRV